MQKIINLSIALLVLSSLQICADATTDKIVSRIEDLSKRAAADNIKNITQYAAGQNAARSKADVEKFFRTLALEIKRLENSNTTTAQKLEILFLKITANNAGAIAPSFLSRADLLQKAAKDLAKKVAGENEEARKTDMRLPGYTKKYMPILKAKLKELRSLKTPNTAQQIQVLLLDDYVD